MFLFNTRMRRISAIILLLALGLVVIYVARKHEDRKLNYYMIHCGKAGSDDETQYIALKKEGQKYQVQGEMREFPGCRVEQHLGKSNKIEQIPN